MLLLRYPRGLHELRGSFMKGRGIVVCLTSQEHVPRLDIMLRTLRSLLSCYLPVEVNPPIPYLG